MDKHTLGPWVHEYGNDTGPNDDCFAEFYEIIAAEKVIGQFDSEDDARVASAAPDLLEALEELLVGVGNSPAANRKYAKARAAIAKARGEP